MSALSDDRQEPGHQIKQVTPAYRVPLVTSWTSCGNMKFDGNKMMETFGGCRR
jgi:hypothetical protein